MESFADVEPVERQNDNWQNFWGCTRTWNGTHSAIWSVFTGFVASLNPFIMLTHLPPSDLQYFRVWCEWNLFEVKSSLTNLPGAVRTLNKMRDILFTLEAVSMTVEALVSRGRCCSGPFGAGVEGCFRPSVVWWADIWVLGDSWP